MRYTAVFFLSFLLFLSCKPEPKKEVALLQTMLSPAGSSSSLPFLFSNDDTTLLSWVEKVGDSLTELKYAELLNDKWQEPKLIHQGTDWFVNWADFPAIAENKGSLISHVLKKSTVGTYSYDVKLNLLQAGQTEWKTDVPLHTDGTPTEHGFVSVLPYKDGFFMTWLDGRNTEEDADGNRGAMTLRAAEVSVTGEIRNEIELDTRICDCCQTTAAITTNGPVVMYRNRSEEEVRDMSIVRLQNGSWTAPKMVYDDNWKIKGCPVNGPKAAVLKNTLAMAWFTAATNKPKVKLVFSSDGGASFDMPIVVSKANAMGRVDVLLLNEDEAIISWMEAHDKKAQLKIVKVTQDGTLGKEQVIAELDASRKTGFPQIEKVGNKIYFAWTDYSTNESQIKTAVISTDAL